MSSPKFKNLAGQRFGALVVQSPTDKRCSKSVVWLCRCDCGKDVEVSARRLMFGRESCGCRIHKRAAARDTRPSRYTPLDALLERPRVRLLRALRWRSGATFDDLAIALDLSRSERTTYAQSLGRLVDNGDAIVERRFPLRHHSASHAAYAITAAGRSRLAAMLAVDEADVESEAA